MRRVRVVVCEIWVLFVILGEALFHSRDFLFLHWNLYNLNWGHMSVITPSYSTLDVLTWSHEQGEEVHATCFVLRAVQGCCMKRLPSTRTMYWHFGNPRNNLLSTGIVLAPWFFESWNGTWQGCSSLQHQQTTWWSFLFFIFVERQLGIKVGEKSPKNTQIPPHEVKKNT